jgi:glycosyltransferase involved in cell wall biosynthesis
LAWKRSTLISEGRMKEETYNAAHGAGLVSVIIPVYNCEQYLAKCLDSVMGQTYKNIETLLVNDGSTDNSAEICKLYAEKDGRVKVITTLNSGPASARNVGIKNAGGSLFLFLDADDFIEQDAIEMLVCQYRQSKADIIVGDFVKIKEGVHESGHKAVFPESRFLSRDDLVAYTRSYLKKPNRFPLFVYSWGRLFNASIIRNNNILFNPDLRTYEDVAFNFEYLKYANGLYFLNRVVYNHLLHENYMSASMTILNNPEKLFGYHHALVNVRDYLANAHVDADIEREVGHAYTCYTIIQLVRVCGQGNDKNKRMIYSLVCDMVKNETLRKSLQYYAPSGKDSRVMPVLLRLKLVRLIILVCKYKALKRYKGQK